MYVDTSAFLKVLVPESESERVAGSLNGRRDLVASVLLRTEVAAALRRKELEGAIEASHVDAALAYLDASTASRALRLLPLTEEVLQRAQDILRISPAHTLLRTLDALHVATALEAGEASMLTFDLRMKAAAESPGIAVADLG